MSWIFVAAAFVLHRVFLAFAVGTNTSVAPSSTSKKAPIRSANWVLPAIYLCSWQWQFIFLAAIEAYISKIKNIKPDSIRHFLLQH
jgi:hypothetical protein